MSVPPTHRPAKLRIGGWTVEPLGGVVERDGERRHLRPKAMDLLTLLAASPDGIVPKEEILRRLWPDTVVEEGAIAFCVAELRKALGDDARHPAYIETYHRRGYRLIAPVQLAPPQAPMRHRRWRSAILVMLPLALLGLAIVAVAWRATRLGVGADARATPRAAVIALTNLSRSGDDAWIGDAVAHLLTAELVSITDLHLVPREVVSRSRRDLPLEAGSDAGESARQLQRRLAVDYVFGGHYVVADEQDDALRLDLTAIDGATGRVVAAAVRSGNRDLLPEMVTFAALELREALGLPDRSHGRRPRGGAGALLPASYFQALEHLERFETETARTLLEEAATAAPDVPWPRLALAEAWSQLGYDGRAAEVVDEALARSDGLTGADKMWLEARAHALAGRLPNAIERFEALALLEPGNLEYRLALASARVEAGQVEAALEGLGELGREGTAAAGDPRLPVVAGEARLGMGDAEGAMALAEAALEQSRRLRAQAAEGRALYLLARARQLDGKVHEAEEALALARGRFVLARDRAGEAQASATLSTWLERRGEVVEAVEASRAALAIARDTGDRRGEAAALRLLGHQLWQQGDREKGEAAILRALAIARETADRVAEASIHNELGIARARMSAGPAQPHFEQAAAIYRQLGHRAGLRNAMMNLGRVAMLKGRMREALIAYREVEGLVDVLDPDSRAVVAFNLGYAYQMLGEIEPAMASFRTAAALFAELENPSMLGAALEGVGSTALLAGDLPRATALLWASLRLRQRLGHAPRIARAEVVLARAWLELGQLAEAERTLHDALERARDESGGSVRPAIFDGLALVHLAQGRPEEARAAAAELERYYGAGDPFHSISGAGRQVTVARVLAATGDREKADDLLARAMVVFEEKGAAILLLEAQLALHESGAAAGEALDPALLVGLEGRARALGLRLLAAKAAKLRAGGDPPARQAA